MVLSTGLVYSDKGPARIPYLEQLTRQAATKGYPMQRGQVLILAIVGIAVAMASYTCWHHYRKGYHALRMWGPESATLIRHAQQVRLLKLAPGSGSREENPFN